jgi:thiol:disulfide interchange protein
MLLSPFKLTLPGMGYKKAGFVARLTFPCQKVAYFCQAIHTERLARISWRSIHFYEITMKRTAFFIFCLLLVPFSQAQVLQPAKWHYEISPKTVKAGQTAEVIFYADIQENWYLYSSDFDPDLGPMLTAFTFTPDAGFQTVGKVKPISPKKKYDDTWGGEYTYFTKKAEFRQTIKVLKSNPVIKGTFEYQVCSNVDGKCIPGEGDFQITDLKVLAGDISKSNVEIPKTPEKPEIKGPEKPLPVVPDTAGTFNLPDKKQNIAPAVSPKNTNSTTTDSGSFWLFLVTAIGAGIATILTPCMYPMMPMTVTFFLKQSTSRRQALLKALIYGLSIIGIFMIPGILVAIFQTGDDAANYISTHWLPNAIFFIIFVIFGLSFLGLFEIVLPSSLINRVDAQADKSGGYTGIFFMAVVLVLVSFSCTGPFVGSLLGLAKQGNFWEPIAGFAAYGLTVATPFMVLAVFPNLIQKLPRSGDWLNAVKVFFGFLELALSLKFLSKIDQVYHWGFLDRDVFLAFWIVIFSLMGFYFLGKLQLPHDSKPAFIPVPRLLIAIFCFAFVVWLVPGMFGSPLSPLAGYLPPQTTIDDRNLYLQPNSPGVFANQSPVNEKVKYAEKFKLPYRLPGFFDFQQGLAYAKKMNKPVFIDFTGHGCENCREMEARVWSDPQVLQRLRNDFVVIALYVDDKTELPENEWIKNKEGKFRKTIGSQNITLEIERFGANAQPYYCLLNPEGELLTPPKAYDLSVPNFVQFLDTALKNFQSGKSNSVKTVSLP